MSKYFFMPSVSAMGIECLKEVPSFIKENNFKKALIVTDKVLVQIGLVGKVTDLLEANEIEYIIYDETKPNPTVKNVEDGLTILKEGNCDFVITCDGFNINCLRMAYSVFVSLISVLATTTECAAVSITSSL